MAEPDAHAFHRISVMHTALAAGRNAFIIPIVLVEWLAFVNIAETLALVCVAIVPSVKLLIMCQFVHACEITKVIHSLAADQFQEEYVS